MTGLSPQTLQVLGWTLLHFVWQGAALAALLAAAMTVIRSANVRYALGIATLILMAAAPVITFGWLDGTASSEANIQIPMAATFSANVASDPEVLSSASLVDGLAAHRQDMMLWLVEAWFVGVMLLSVRTAGGLLWLARARRGQIEPLSEETYRRCLELQRKLGLNRNIRYGQCDWLDTPVVLGWFRPVVLVTTQAITGLSPQQLQAIIAHELAHIRRFDAFVNLFQIGVEMLLFYHPAVWWVSRRVRIEREVCCDHEALAACGEPVSYARALTLMEEWRTAPSLLMAANGGPLAERVLRLLGLQGTSARSRIAGIGVSVLGVAIALSAGYVFVAAAQAAPDERAVAADVEEPPAAAAPSPAAAPAPVAAPTPVSAPKSEPAPAPRPAAAPQPPKQPSRVSRAQQTSDQVEGTTPKKGSYVESLAAAGFRNLSVEDVIAMKVQGITPEYIEAMRATQLHPDAEQLIAMKVHDVTPGYVDEMRKLVADADVEDFIAMKVHDVSPQFIRELWTAGFETNSAEQLIAAKVHDISAQFIKSATDHGFRDLTLEKLIMLRTADVI